MRLISIRMKKTFTFFENISKIRKVIFIEVWVISIIFQSWVAKPLHRRCCSFLIKTFSLERPSSNMHYSFLILHVCIRCQIKSNSTFIYKRFILCLDSLALKSKRNKVKPLPGYHEMSLQDPRCSLKFVVYSCSFTF